MERFWRRPVEGVSDMSALHGDGIAAISVYGIDEDSAGEGT
jgi:hypothetical protein